MAIADRIHILGASGSGTSTLGALLAARYGYQHIDVDNYFWEPSDPPFQHQREVGERQRLLAGALREHRRWVVTGSMCRWGNIFVPLYELVVFLFVPHDIRMARLRERERGRWGADAIAPGGKMRETYDAFMSWAASYDLGDETIRSLRLHEKWLTTLPCARVRLEGALAPDEQIARLAGFLAGC